jgi:hypothetical protein
LKLISFTLQQILLGRSIEEKRKGMHTKVLYENLNRGDNLGILGIGRTVLKGT